VIGVGAQEQCIVVHIIKTVKKQFEREVDACLLLCPLGFASRNACLLYWLWDVVAGNDRHAAGSLLLET
jgi:hypothetical protein